MPRLLPAGILVLSAAVAQAQTPDSLISTVPDSAVGGSLQPASFSNYAVTKHDSASSPASLPAFTTLSPAFTRVAGVQVTPYSGAPGAWSTVRIRGIANVTGSSQPLYVVDGVPVYNLDSTPEQWTGPYSQSDIFTSAAVLTTPFSPASNPLLDMPLENITQIEVVKGAAATAQYGAQGTNGVIRISTRRGAGGQPAAQSPRVRYAGWVGLQQVRQRYDLLNARQFADLVNVAAANNRLARPYSATELNALGEANRQDEVFRTAGIQSHNLSLDGLTAHNTRYYVAADYLRQTGVVRASSLSRYSLRANLEQQLTTKLTVGLRAAGSQLDQRQPGYEPDAGPLLRQFLLAAPAVPARLASPVAGSNSGLPGRLLLEGRTPTTRRLLAQLQARYELAPGLVLHAQAGLERAATDSDYQQDYTTESPGSTRYQRQETAAIDLTSYVASAELRYQRILARHTFEASLSYLRQQYKQTTYRREQQESRSQYGYSFASYEASYTIKADPTHSPFASFSYVYGGRYEVRASLRADKVTDAPGQPIFNNGVVYIGEPERNYHLFPGGEVRWHVGQERFLREVAALRTLTMQAGAGRTSSYFSLDRTTHFDAGLQLGLLEGRLTAEAGVYERRTTRAQAAVPVPSVTGGTLTVVYPEMDLRNRGLELTVSGNWQLGRVQGLSTAAAATIANRVTRLPDSGVQYAAPGLEEGQSVGRFFVFQQDGIAPAGSLMAGQVRLRDTNQDGGVSFEDGRYQGSRLPRYTLSLYQQLQLNRWQLEAQLDGLFGYQLYNSTLTLLDAPTGVANSTQRALTYWTSTNQDTTVPEPGGKAFTATARITDQNLASGDHLRLSQLSLSYEVLHKAQRRASVWVGGQNLFVLGSYRGFDPNVSSGGAAPLYAGRDASVYPVARVWQVGVRGQF